MRLARNFFSFFFGGGGNFLFFRTKFNGHPHCRDFKVAHAQSAMPRKCSACAGGGREHGFPGGLLQPRPPRHHCHTHGRSKSQGLQKTGLWPQLLSQWPQIQKFVKSMWDPLHVLTFEPDFLWKSCLVKSKVLVFIKMPHNLANLLPQI